TSESDYKSILSEFLQRQVIIFGHQVVDVYLRDVKGLTIDSEGVVKKIEGDPQAIIQEIVGRLSVLSDYAVKHSLDSVVLSHAQSSPVPADVSHLPSMEEKILESIPVASNSQTSS
ncbi:MAG TPA: hypothetical protein PLD54_05185, partial [Candidatus Levybacteria bacterium]|nr:hypothetical protein [Candidatus Levybacteria bacterium]